MNTFLVLYMAPIEALEAWMKTDPAVRKEAEEKMKSEWNAWQGAHATMLKQTAGAGKTKRVTASGISDVKNNIMLYSIVEAESHDAAAKMFEGHPHFGIPDASIEIMQINYLPGMN